MSSEQLICEDCGNPFRTKWNRNRQRYFCSLACYHASGRAPWSEYGQRYEITQDGRRCYRCAAWKPWDAYGSLKRSAPERYRDGYPAIFYVKQASCKACLAGTSQAWRYGMTGEDYRWLLNEQQNRCALCRRPPGTRRLSVDHDHSCSGHPDQRGCRHCIRGLLCNFCNSRLVPYAEQHEVIRARFADYLASRPLLLRIPASAGPGRGRGRGMLDHPITPDKYRVPADPR